MPFLEKEHIFIAHVFYYLVQPGPAAAFLWEGPVIKMSAASLSRVLNLGNKMVPKMHLPLYICWTPVLHIIPRRKNAVPALTHHDVLHDRLQHHFLICVFHQYELGKVFKNQLLEFWQILPWEKKITACSHCKETAVQKTEHRLPREWSQ